MGGRGGSSGKTSQSSGVSGGGTSTGGAATGNRASSGGVGGSSKAFVQSKTPIKQMSDRKLREELIKAAGHYYASGKSGISFGGRDPYQVAAILANQKMSRSRMEKEYKSILKKLK